MPERIAQKVLITQNRAIYFDRKWGITKAPRLSASKTLIILNTNTALGKNVQRGQRLRDQGPTGKLVSGSMQCIFLLDVSCIQVTSRLYYKTTVKSLSTLRYG